MNLLDSICKLDTEGELLTNQQPRRPPQLPFRFSDPLWDHQWYLVCYHFIQLTISKIIDSPDANSKTHEVCRHYQEST